MQKNNYKPKGKVYMVIKDVYPLNLKTGLLFEREKSVGGYVLKNYLGEKVQNKFPFYNKAQIRILLACGVVVRVMT